jgi:hypothetical protein
MSRIQPQAPQYKPEGAMVLPKVTRGQVVRLLPLTNGLQPRCRHGVIRQAVWARPLEAAMGYGPLGPALSGLAGLTLPYG